MSTVDAQWVERYLALVGLPREAPSVDALARLIRGHLSMVPFENSGSLLRRLAAGEGPVAPLDPEVLLAAWEARSAGGVCFEHTSMFERLLGALGYPYVAIAGEISFPGSHQALLVDAGGARWLVDVGNGAPFFEPIPLDGPFEIHRAGLGYRFRAAEDGSGWVQERALEGGWKPYCRYPFRPQEPGGREQAYQRHHRPRETWVTSTMVAIRSREDEVLVVRDGDQTRYTAGGKVTERVDDAAGWARLPGLLGLPALPLVAVARAWASINGRDLPPGL
ncbi:MAG: arylamine N-acetyltransferase [Anaeromyxobacter sp.]